MRNISPLQLIRVTTVVYGLALRVLAAVALVLALPLAQAHSIRRSLRDHVRNMVFPFLDLTPTVVNSWTDAFLKNNYSHSVLSTVRNVPMLQDMMPM